MIFLRAKWNLQEGNMAADVNKIVSIHKAYYVVSYTAHQRQKCKGELHLRKRVHWGFFREKLEGAFRNICKQAVRLAAEKRSWERKTTSQKVE